MLWLVSSAYRISVMHGRGLFVIHHVYFRQIVHVSSSEIFLMKLYAFLKILALRVLNCTCVGNFGLRLCILLDDWGLAYRTFQH